MRVERVSCLEGVVLFCSDKCMLLNTLLKGRSIYCLTVFITRTENILLHLRIFLNEKCHRCLFYFCDFVILQPQIQ